LKLEGRLAIFSIFSYLFQIAELYCILYLLPLIFPTRYTYSSIYSFLSPTLLSWCLFAALCSPSGLRTQPNPFSYHSPHDVSYNGGGLTSSFQSIWICGEDCHISEVSWSGSTSLSLSHTCAHTLHMNPLIHFPGYA
jgi:hypothetical protein